MRKFALVCTLILLVGMVGCAKEEELLERSKTEDVAVAVTAEKLIADYKENEVKADVTYKDKVIAVTGKIHKIEKGLGGHPILLLEAPKRFIKVRCQYGKDYIQQIASLNKGQMVTAKGICQGKFGTVNLHACVVP